MASQRKCPSAKREVHPISKTIATYLQIGITYPRLGRRHPIIELGTKQKAIREAHSLLQKFGFNGFSFQHIADTLGIKKPSLYAHFESKEALGLDIIETYKQWFFNWVDTTSETTSEQKISAYYDMLFKISQKGKLYCPIASLNAESHTPPPSMRKELKSMHELQVNWMKKIITEGQATSNFRCDLTVDELADFVIGLSVGGQFLARIVTDSEKLKTMKRHAFLFLQGS
ncbi:MAG: TetR/AcrR family transcriptional regulator [Oligoflexus sp.]|nr:TetR/AcrR family transcriptional regulator [Oligoflexus sp.]